MAERIVVTAALTGVLANRNQCPAIPYTPDEIAREAQRAFDAGAAVAHIHAREDDGMPCFRKERYAEILQAVRARSPIIINFSTGAIGLPMEERVGHIRDLSPEIGALNMGSMNYAKFSAKSKTFIFDFTFDNKFSDIITLLEAARDGNVKPELECFTDAHVFNTEPLVEMGVLRPPLDFSLIMGVLGGTPATTRHLVHQVSNLPRGSTWKVIGISRAQWSLVAAALSMGGGVRVGLEDNFYLPSGEMASSNGQLVETAVRMSRDTGLEPASVDEAKKFLSLGGDGPWGRGPAGAR